MHTQNIVKIQAASILGIEPSNILAVTFTSDDSGYVHLNNRDRIYLSADRWNERT